MNTSDETSATRVNHRGSRRRWSWPSFLIGLLVGVAIALSGSRILRPAAIPVQSATVVTAGGPRSSMDGQAVAGLQTETLLMSDVLKIAKNSLQSMRQNVNDYTATLIKQEVINGTLSEATQMDMKVMCVHRNQDRTDSQPIRVYLRFVAPESVVGREVIWAQDLYDGQLIVHEAGFLGLVTLYLDPLGPIAMQGQRYPISEIGIAKLVQKLIERGELDCESPDVTVTKTTGMKLDGLEVELIVVTRKEPTSGENNFSRAEIVLDSKRLIPLRYTAFGWPKDGEAPPLLESYTYSNVKLNVGLSDSDFDPKNPEYKYP